MNNQILFLSALLLPAGNGPAEDITLKAKDASVSGPGIIQTDVLGYWDNGTAEWTLQFDQPIEQMSLMLEYAAPYKPNRAKARAVIPGFFDKKFKIETTDGWNSFTYLKIGSVSLPAGTHALSISYQGPADIMKLKRVLFTPQPEKYTVPSEFPPLFVQEENWAETMTALRAAFRDANMPVTPIDRYLNKADGKALWAAFPRESDWFLQDNQVHGQWGRGFYDARQDYKHYLDPERDSTLEQKLIENVLEELVGHASRIRERVSLGIKTEHKLSEYRDSKRGPVIAGQRPWERQPCPATDLKKQFEQLISGNTSPDDPAWLKLYVKACGIRRQQRLEPLLEETKQIIYATHMNMGTIYLATETQGCPPGSQLRLIDLTPEASGNPLTDDLLFDSGNGIVRDPEISFNGKKLLFAWRKTNEHLKTRGRLAPKTGNYKIVEMDLATREMRQLTDDTTYGADIEPCYLPDGNIMFSSIRCVQEVTCGWGDASNLYVMDQDGRYARRVGFDQTQTAFPHLLNDGRVVYTRRDYNDRGQSYAHALFVMNPDGTKQTEYYGNNSMAPTSIQHTRPIPGSRKTMGVAGGYHTTQGGKLVTIDVSKGRQNYDGLTFYNWEPTPLAEVSDENYCRVGEQYAYPYPFSENSLLVSFSPVGAYLTSADGKLNSKKEQERMLYKLYYMTLDGRRELLAAHPELSCTQAVPVRSRPVPPARPGLVDYTQDTGICYVQDVYYGPSAEGIEPGSIQKLRVVKLHYKPVMIGAGGWSPPHDQVGPGRKYAGYGWHSVLPAGVGSVSFDTKTILGEVDVHADGSVLFEVPARTPLYFQLVDKDGLVVQTMRSWATLMPNETFSCVGCHEENDSAPLPQASRSIAMQNPPQKLQPLHRISGKPFSYPKMVQPIWDAHCIACHAPGEKAQKIDLSATLVSDNPADRDVHSTRRKFNRSYLTLLQVKWVPHKLLDNPRLDEGRPNEWVDYYTRMATVELTPPYYAGSTQSGLINMLRKGHGGTTLSRSEIDTVAAWIDLNVPYVGEYDEMNIWDDEAKELYKTKLGMRRKMEAIEAENIEQYIHEVQGK